MSQSFNQTKLSEIKQQAIDWLILLCSDDVSDVELLSFARWLAEDHAHSEAFASAEKLYAEMTYAVGAPAIVESNNLNVEHKTSPGPSATDLNQVKRSLFIRRQRWFAAAIAMAAVWLFATLLYLPNQFFLWDKWTSDYYTQTGETQEILLPDGGYILLNTNSAVSLAYNDSVRTIILHHGQAVFCGKRPETAL